MTPRRIFDFLKRYLFKHPFYVIVYVANYFSHGFAFREHFYTKEEVGDLISRGKSIIRFGDGEINLLLDLRNHYHAFNPKLKKMMKEIVSSYSTESNYVLSIVKFINYSNDELKKIGKFHVWLPIKTVFFLMFPKNVSYMDAHNFYYDNYFEEVIAPFLKDKKIIFITKKETIEKQKANSIFPWKDFDYIETPEYDALGAYENVKKSLDELLKKYPTKDIVLLVGMGPVGKYLIFEYSKIGVCGIDVGIGIETIFTGKSLEYLI